MARKKTEPINVILVILTYISFSLAYWYYSRDAVVMLDISLAFLANDLVAAIAAGVVPFLVFEVAVFLLLKPKTLATQYRVVHIQNPFEQSAPMPQPPKPTENHGKIIMRLRLFVIAANLVSFVAAFMYFLYRPLYVWGSVLMNFVIMLIFFIAFLAFQVKKMEDKTKCGVFVSRMGSTFLFIHGAAAIISLALTSF